MGLEETHETAEDAQVRDGRGRRSEYKDLEAIKMLAGKNPIVEELVSEMKAAAASRLHGVMLCYTDCGIEELAAVEMLRSRGFCIVTHAREVRGRFGELVEEHPAFYAVW